MVKKQRWMVKRSEFSEDENLRGESLKSAKIARKSAKKTAQKVEKISAKKLKNRAKIDENSAKISAKLAKNAQNAQNAKLAKFAQTEKSAKNENSRAKKIEIIYQDENSEKFAGENLREKSAENLANLPDLADFAAKKSLKFARKNRKTKFGEKILQIENDEKSREISQKIQNSDAQNLAKVKSFNAQLSEISTLKKSAKKEQFREKVKNFITRKGKYSLSTAACGILIFISLFSIVFAFFSDIISRSLTAKAGCLQITPTLKIDGETGDALNVPNLQSSATCIPAKYQTVEYVQFSGAQYINTGVDQLDNTVISADFADLSSASNLTTSSMLFGSWTASYGNMAIFGHSTLYPANFMGSLRVGNDAAQQKPVASFNGERNTVVMDVGAMTVSMNGGTATTYTAKPTGAANARNIYLGAINNDNSYASAYFIGKIYGVKMQKNDDLVRNFIPVYDKEADECLLYDTVSQKPFENQGTGKITCPNPNAKNCGIPPAGATAYKKVDFVTFSGAQFINTGISATGENMELSAKASFDADAATMSTIFGSSASGDFGGVWAFRYGNDAIFARYGGTSPGNISPLVNDTPYTVEYKTGEGFFVNGTKKMAEASGVARPTVEVPIYLGANNKSNTVAQNFLVGNVYSFAITKGDVSLNLIPVQDDAGNYGFFDTVSNKFFANSGSGSLTGATASENAEIYYADFGKSDPLACGGQNQGETAGKVAVNEIHDFSYKLQNTGTVDYKNYTGDKISAWLDYDYAPVEYVQFSGAQYLDTKINQTGDIKVFADFQYSAAPASGAIIDLFGAGLLGNSNSFAFGYNNQLGNNNEFVANYRAASSTGFATGDLARHTITKTNGTTVLTNVAGATKTNVMADNFITAPAVNISLGRITNVANRDFVGKVYAFSIEKSGEKVRDLIPVKNLKTQECGFYDKVSGEFFANLGTGDLICGAEIANSTPKILLYSPNVADATIQSDISAAQASGGISSSAISAINGAECLANFAGNNNQNVISPVCQTGILSGTLNAETAVNEFYNSPNYRFAIAVSPEFAEIYAKVKINFGVSSGAQGLTAVNWREVVNPYVGANLSVPKGAPPVISAVANKNLAPFVGQVVADSATPDPAKKQMKKTDYLRSLVSATDAEDENCAFSGANSACEIAVADEGGFDANKPGKYQITYSATDSDGNSAEFTVEVQVVKFTSVATGRYNSAAIDSAGRMFVVGLDTFGMLGNGNSTAVSSPTLNSATSVKFKSADFIWEHSLGISTDGTLYSWGETATGKLFYTLPTDRQTTPKKVENPAGSFVKVGGYCDTSFALTTAGDLWVAGASSYATGANGANTAAAPQKLDFATAKIVDIATGATGNCTSSNLAVDSAGNLYSWGYYKYGSIGMGGSSGDFAKPMKIYDAVTGRFLLANGTVNSSADSASAGVKMSKVSIGEGAGLAVAENGDIYAWGSDIESDLGDGVGGGSGYSPEKIYDAASGKFLLENNNVNPNAASPNSATKMVSLATNYATTFAIDENGNLYSWGRNNLGQSGNNSTGNNPNPARIYNAATGVFLGGTTLPAGTKIAEVSADGWVDESFALILAENGQIFAVGEGGSGKLGTGNTTRATKIVPTYTNYPPLSSN